MHSKVLIIDFRSLGQYKLNDTLNYLKSTEYFSQDSLSRGTLSTNTIWHHKKQLHFSSATLTGFPSYSWSSNNAYHFGWNWKFLNSIFLLSLLMLLLFSICLNRSLLCVAPSARNV